MKKINFTSVGETIYEDVLPNNLKVVYFPTKKSKNYYLSVSTNYGAKILEYKKDDETIKIIPGTAHFLEHRIMDFTKNKKAADLINGFGSAPNAYTSYDVTNYNLFGSVDIIKNLELLLDRVFKPNITEKDVKMEKGIINEEIDMQIDNMSYNLINKLIENALVNDKGIAHPVLGTKDDIEKITSKYLKSIYEDFYTYDRMHVVIIGDFELDEVSTFVNHYFEKTESNKKNIKITKIKEPTNVQNNEVTITNSLSSDKVGVLYKVPINKYKGVNINKYDNYISLLMGILFGNSSDFYQKLKDNNITQFGYITEKVNNYTLMIFLANTKDKELFYNLIEEELKNLKVTKKEFEIKIKLAISSLILLFEDIVTIEDYITNQIIDRGKIIKNARKELEGLDYEEFKLIINDLNFENKVKGEIIK